MIESSQNGTNNISDHEIKEEVDTIMFEVIKLLINLNMYLNTYTRHEANLILQYCNNKMLIDNTLNVK